KYSTGVGVRGVMNGDLSPPLPVAYRARDTKLKRDVAIKTLPDEFSHDGLLKTRETSGTHALGKRTRPAFPDTSNAPRTVQKLDCAVPVNSAILFAQLKRRVIEIQDHRVLAAFEPFLKYFDAPIGRPGLFVRPPTAELLFKDNFAVLLQPFCELLFRFKFRH